MIDDEAVAKRWRYSDAVRLTRSASRKKNWRVHFRHRGWWRQRYLPPRLRGDMARPTTIALDSSFNLHLISRILLDSDWYCRHHVIIGINSLTQAWISNHMPSKVWDESTYPFLDFNGPVGPRLAPCWPHEPCFQGGIYYIHRRSTIYTPCQRVVVLIWLSVGQLQR